MDENKKHISSESLTEFKKSLLYGKRNNLFFKFLANDNYSEDEFADFLETILHGLANSIDNNDFEALKDYIFTSQLKGYKPKKQPGEFVYESSPWNEFSNSLSDSKLSMISTGGFFCKGDDPMDPPGMTQEEAIKNIAAIFKLPPYLSAIPVNTPRENLVIRQPGYDIRAAKIDPNVVFPYEILKDLMNKKIFQSSTDNFYSFVGASGQSNLIKNHIPKWADLMRSQNVDGVLLVPA
jgi:hypothetical protein